MWRLTKINRLLTRWEGDLLDGVMVVEAAAANLLIPKHGVGIFTNQRHPLFRQSPIQPVWLPYLTMRGVIGELAVCASGFRKSQYRIWEVINMIEFIKEKITAYLCPGE